MSPAEQPEPGLADLPAGHAADGPGADAPAPPLPEREAEIERLQSRLNDLRTRIQSALPEGYDLTELIAASGDRHESEEVFEITGEIDALQNLAGPLTVPGKTPQPAFDDLPEVKPLPDYETDLASANQTARWRWLVLLVVLIVAVAAGIALLLPYL